MKKGCLDDCIYLVDIKIEEMKIKYKARCKKYQKYLKEDDIKKTCKGYDIGFKITYNSLDDIF